MGLYLNPPDAAFRRCINSTIYVDKTGLIEETNKLLGSMQKYICVSRPRRFGKTSALNMLSAYYSSALSSDSLFQGFSIHNAPSYRTHLNRYEVIRIDMQTFVSLYADPLGKLQEYLIRELTRAFPDIYYLDRENLVQVMGSIYSATGRSFVILIDEWDCLFRESKDDRRRQTEYLDFLRAWLKDKDYAELVYMTGILPIKKYGTHSALNMFSEYSMLNPGPMSQYFGFTQEEVAKLSGEFSMDLGETRAWYDGYSAGKISVYSPRSVSEAFMRRSFGPYWNSTETYEALKTYIDLDMDGLRECVVRMLAGESVPINPGTFANDMTTFATKDDVMTLLVHLGYLSYDGSSGSVRIPNKEVSIEYVNSIAAGGWGEVARAVRASKSILNSLWDMDGDAVAKGVEAAHNEISILKYNDENSLSCTVSLAFYYAREYYTVTREQPAGSGFADIVLTPRPFHPLKPAVIIELKRDSSPERAIEQIKEKRYADRLSDYDTLLVGIAYDSRTKKHSCKIERHRQ